MKKQINELDRVESARERHIGRWTDRKITR